MLFVIVFSQLSIAVTLSGRAYGWETLSPVQGAIVQIMQNSSVVSQVVTDGRGEYGVNLAQGSYVLNTVYMEGSKVIYFSHDEITIVSEEDTTFDIVLFPPTEETIPEIELMDIPALDLDFYGNETLPPIVGEEKADNSLYFILLLIIIGGAVTPIVCRKKIPAKLEKTALPEELSKVVGIIKGEKGRMQQRELQKALGLSAAKTSLLITDLEERGMVKRIKRGRGNVIILK